MKVITVTVEDRDGKEISTLETCDEQAAEKAIKYFRARNPDALIVRSEREATS